jgi:lipopolysaccharide/colanic/teichoic acid biosynthesis glycosyltransferase
MIKRFIDIAVSAAGLLLISPLMMFTAVAVRAAMGGPILFRQQRYGRDGKPFMLLKFRSMTNARDHNGKLLPDAARVTQLGRILRQSKMDELPQLFNILAGDMSLVGPRPLVVFKTGAIGKQRYGVRPGLTGIVQTSCVRPCPAGKADRLDAWYARNHSLCFDFAIVVRTLPSIVQHIDSQDSPSGRPGLHP